MSWACRGRVSEMSWTCRGRVVDVSWTCRGRVVGVSWVCAEREVRWRGGTNALAHPRLRPQAPIEDDLDDGQQRGPPVGAVPRKGRLRPGESEREGASERERERARGRRREREGEGERGRERGERERERREGERERERGSHKRLFVGENASSDAARHVNGCQPPHPSSNVGSSASSGLSPMSACGREVRLAHLSMATGTHAHTHARAAERTRRWRRRQCAAGWLVASSLGTCPTRCGRMRQQANTARCSSLSARVWSATALAPEPRHTVRAGEPREDTPGWPRG